LRSHTAAADFLTPDDREEFHTLTCPLCGRWGLEGLFLGAAVSPKDATEGEETGEIDGGFWRRLEEKAPWLAAEAERRRKIADELLAELAPLPPGDREAAAGAERFRCLDLFELLATAGRDAQLASPEEARSFAECAVRVAAGVLDVDPEEGRPALARALCLAANAARLRGDFGEAESALARAVRLLDGVEDRAEYCRALALVRWEQGRADEAHALLERAWSLFRLLEDADAQAASAALLGLLHAEEGWHASAMPFLVRGWRDLDRGAHPELALRTGLALAYAFALAGDGGRAREALREVWQLQRRVSGAEGTRACWQQARVLSHLGDGVEARYLLRSVRDRLAEEGSLPEAFLASIDLAVLHAEAGELKEIPGLAAVLEARFAGAVFPEELARLWAGFPGFQAEAFAGRAALRKAAEEVMAVQRRAFRRLGRPLRPVPFT
jgi:tetratricopeptide (TPR) repeat protein